MNEFTIDDLVKKKTVDAPNFSVVVPADCGCSCNFCFDRQSKKPNLGGTEWLSELEDVIDKLPPQYAQVSVTGGEPTLFPDIIDLLDLLRPRFNKIVLTTNGERLTDDIIQRIDFLNISRHHYDDDVNAGIFGKTPMLPSYRIPHICQLANKMGKPVTLNCVLTGKILDHIEEYVKFAKRMDASTVCFRKIADGSLAAPNIPILNNRTIHTLSECPVCATYLTYINGMPVTWKTGMRETHYSSDRVFELIYGNDGILSEFWGEAPDMNTSNVERLQKEIQLLRDEIHVLKSSNRSPIRSSTGGCSTSGCG